MTQEQFQKAQKIKRSMSEIQNAKKEMKERIDNLCMKTISYGQEEPGIRPVLRALFIKLEPIIDKHFETEFKALKNEFDKV